MAFNAKNLHYEKQEPAFLRRLKSAHDAADGRQNVQIARPKKARLKTGDEDEDDPVFLDEDGKVLQKFELEVMQKNDSSDNAVTADTNDHNSTTTDAHERTDIRDVQQIAQIGGSKKRKQARVIDGADGGEGDDDKNNNKVGPSRKPQGNSKSKDGPSSLAGDTEDSNPKLSKPVKVKKKAKKIKLSFDDPE